MEFEFPRVRSATGSLVCVQNRRLSFVRKLPFMAKNCALANVLCSFSVCKHVGSIPSVLLCVGTEIPLLSC